MNAHTEGRLTASQILDDGRYGLLDEENRIIVGVSWKLTEADARRMAACWNACIGVNTEVIESFSSAALRVQVAEEMAARYEIAAARALLADVLKFDSALLRAAETPAADLLIRIRTLLKGNAA